MKYKICCFGGIFAEDEIIVQMDKNGLNGIDK